ncbi:hypothetical protein [Nocardioides ultimimeridianus]
MALHARHRRKTHRTARWIGTAGAALLASVALTATSAPANAALVAPVTHDGNAQVTDCPTGTIGYEAAGWTTSFADQSFGDGTFMVHIHTYDDGNGNAFDFSQASSPVQAVFVKGSAAYNVYDYAGVGAVTSDTDLHPPLNASGMWAGFSHVIFCYEPTLSVSKTVSTTYTRAWNWTIDKSVTPASWDLFQGDSGTSTYTVKVTRTGSTDSAWAMSGSIHVSNPNAVAATVTGVTDSLTGNVSCPVTFPYQLAAGGSFDCSYSGTLSDGSDRTNRATVTTAAGTPVHGGYGEAAVHFGDPTTVVNSTIHVTDSQHGSLGSFSDTGSTSYDRKFTCADKGVNPNTATITETGQSDDASVTVACDKLVVAKDASTSLTRTWTWNIDKSADRSSLLLAEGETFPVNYSVKVSASSADTRQSVTGDIIVTNNNPVQTAHLTAVTDVVSGGITVPVSCPQLTIAPGDSLTCSYAGPLPDSTDRTNTGTATLQNHDFGSDGSATVNGSTQDYSGTAPVSFANATVTKVDECVAVSDTKVGALGTVCAAQAPKTFTYALTFGTPATADVQLACGTNAFTNTASFLAGSGAHGSDSWTVNANVACATGCTLTQGYWKTHSLAGPAPYDDTWAQVGGSGAMFFLSGQTWLQMFNASPAGNAYYNLAHQWAAADLNQLDGASIPATVLSAFNQGKSLLTTYTPAQVAAMKSSSSVRQQFVSLATTLGSYNIGLTGPGHCTE